MREEHESVNVSEEDVNAMSSGSQGKYRPGGAVITLPDPDQMPTSHDQKGTIQWRTGSHKYPNFEIEFIGANPEDTDDCRILAGSDTAPVVLKLNFVGEYSYKVRQLNEKKDRSLLRESGVTAFRVQSCSSCYP